MKKKILIFCLLSAFVLNLCACKGYRETDSEYFVSAVCFEKEQENFKAYVEVLVISPDDKETHSKVFSAQGKTPYAAVTGTTSSMPRTAVFDHCSTAIIDSKITGKDFKDIVKYLYDTKNLNFGIYVFASDDIEKVLNLKPQTASIGYDIMNIQSNISSSTGVDFKNKYYEICSRQISNGGFCLPVVSETDNRPAVSGQTVYFDYSPVIKLNRQEALIFDLIYSGSSGGEINIGGKKCKVNRVSTDLKAEKGTLKINIKCRYRRASGSDNKKLESEIKRVLNKVLGSKALCTLGISRFEKIGKAEVSVNGK